jgi:hypothetical protein
MEVLPNLPTVGDFLPGYEADKLNKEIRVGLTDPKIMSRITDLGGGIDVPRLGFEHREDRPGSGGRRRAQRPRVAYLFANGAPCGSRACTIQTPPGTSMGPLSTLLNLGLVSEHSAVGVTILVGAYADS